MATTTDLWQRFRTNPAWMCAALLAAASALIYLAPWLWLVETQFSHGVQVIELRERDFFNYWSDASAALAPHYRWLLWPFQQLDYVPALVLFLVVTLAGFVAAVRAFRAKVAPGSSLPIVWLAPLGFVLVTLDATQDGFLTGACLLFGFAWMKDRPVLAGLAFACLTVRPQLAVLVPVLLLWDRNWRAAFWTVAFTAGLVGASIAMFGAGSWQAFLGQAPTDDKLLMMPTVFASALSLGFSADSATMMQWVASIAGVVGVAYLLTRERDPLHRCLIVACGTFLIVPYAFNYDMGALSAIAAMAVSSPRIAAHRAGATAMAGIGAMAGIVTNLNRSVPAAPVLFAAGLLIVLFSRTSKHAGSAQ